MMLSIMMLNINIMFQYRPTYKHVSSADSNNFRKKCFKVGMRAAFGVPHAYLCVKIYKYAYKHVQRSNGS